LQLFSVSQFISVSGCLQLSTVTGYLWLIGALFVYL